MKKRRDTASGLLSEAERFTSEAAEKLENFEKAMTKAREEASSLRDKRKDEGHAREAELLENAHREAQEFLRASREQTRNAVAETMADMEKHVPDMADMAVQRLLGKSNRPSAA